MTWNGPLRAGLSGYDVTLPCGSESAQRRHKILGQECVPCGVPEDPPIMRFEGAPTGGNRGGPETRTKRSFDDLLWRLPTTVSNGCAAELTSTHARLANA